MRLALVHEFRTRSKVLVCTEAGAKGLNLQFCETVINYDLPWNPQRIEQRIGRCHRYSQQRDVTVVNFLATDNEAHRLTFEILSQKLDLFGKVLDASDIVLHEPRTDAPEIVVSAVSLEFETDLRNIYSRSRTLDEVTREIAALRDKIAVQEGRLRAGVRAAPHRSSSRASTRMYAGSSERLREELPKGLRAVGPRHRRPRGWLPALARRRTTRAPSDDGRVVFEVARDAALPVEIGDVRRFATGDAAGSTDAAAVESPASAGSRRDRGRSHLAGRRRSNCCCPPDAAPDLAALAGQTGVLAVALVDYAGFEPVQRLVAGSCRRATSNRSVAGRADRTIAGD